MRRVCPRVGVLLCVACLVWAGQREAFPPAGVEMVLIPGGSVWVGCVPADGACYPEEKPGRTVTLTSAFWLDVTEVTVGAYRAFALATGRPLPPPPGFRQDDTHPVVNVSWQDAAEYCAWAGKRLPSEAEWEAAARAGRAEWIYPTGTAISPESANFGGGLARDRFVHTAPVASFPPNPLGLHDLAGNVWEWVADWFAADTAATPAVDPRGPSSGSQRVMKGGAWNSQPVSLRTSNRGRFPPDTRRDTVGFRCARDAGAAAPDGGTAATPAPPKVPVVTATAAPGVATPPPLPAPPSPPPARVVPPATPPASAATLQPARSTSDAAGLQMVFLPPATFQRGCVLGDASCFADEQPRHAVTLTQGFFVHLTEVTVAAYRAFAAATGKKMVDVPSWADDTHPVVNVTWEDAQAYCRWIGGRLPTEAEWEYAARGGVAGRRYPWGDSIDHDHANFDGVGGRDTFPKSAPVGSFPAHGFGLHDTAGNVWEWCADWYAERAYSGEPVSDPSGPAEGVRRVVRGGSWTSDPGRLRTSYRFSLEPATESLTVGFRCVRPVTP